MPVLKCGLASGARDNKLNVQKCRGPIKLLIVRTRPALPD
jgi:hypothetical protein